MKSIMSHQEKVFEYLTKMTPERTEEIFKGLMIHSKSFGKIPLDVAAEELSAYHNYMNQK